MLQPTCMTIKLPGSHSRPFRSRSSCRNWRMAVTIWRFYSSCWNAVLWLLEVRGKPLCKKLWNVTLCMDGFDKANVFFLWLVLSVNRLEIPRRSAKHSLAVSNGCFWRGQTEWGKHPRMWTNDPIAWGQGGGKGEKEKANENSPSFSASDRHSVSSFHGMLCGHGVLSHHGSPGNGPKDWNLGNLNKK